ncbi:hypothetical protein C7T94_11565 [Pedobacter yulinensis]|uniref:Uncharacterized protein n=1 Tax=Pedobacter yulinensis TaxID=2126353 RepID=A0A2T3HLA3_9SPHI|nr:lipocalin family protein [Pedobacter yulinensis]PST83227.1 hypothetical protein C7T94_11565 [Pedobacter yulinensis]
MKKIVLIMALAISALTIQSCSTQNAASAPATVRRGSVIGNWVLNDITFEGIPSQAVRGLFGENSYACFTGSTWNLTNSGNGSYTLTGGTGCASGTQNIFWSASPNDQTFQFKKLMEGQKAKDITDGYRLVLVSADKQSMVLKSPIEYGNATANVVLNFTRAAK